MEITGAYTFAAPRARVWGVLLDPEALRAALPGCQEMRRTGEDEYLATMSVGIGAVKGSYSGTIRVRDQEPESRYRLLVEGTGRPGFVKGDGVLELAEVGATTVVTYSGQVQVGGTIASVGQRLISATVQLLTGQFFKAMDRQLAQQGQQEKAQ